MQIIISNSGDTPIYAQICEQVKAAILTGELKEGDMLPSMRTLAQELRISVITTKRAYEELEREGFVFSQTGRGSFVSAGNLDFIREAQRRDIENSLLEAVRLAKQSNLPLQELTDTLMLLYQED
ncbi:GntR family transcriptional regulator [Christensenellaceae bacterium OttesenSCG-928-L17]|nr:GntR family transcriptional regulator [Christensenellaceae bacterium OttesenSCG-928-L17]